MPAKKMKNSTVEVLIESIGPAAKKQKWEMLYDKTADSLYWKKARLSKESKLAKLSREVSFYVNNQGAVEGVMVQYFKNNYITENKDIAGLTKFLISSGDDDLFVIPKDKKAEANGLLLGFSESIKKDIFKDALGANYTMSDLDKVVTG